MMLTTLFWMFAGLLVVSLLTAGLNMVSMFKKDGPTFKGAGLHMLAGFGAVVGFWGALITGIIWLVRQYL